MLKLSDFDYDLPPELIAQYPTTRRGQSRLMVVDRSSGEIQTGEFADFPSYLERGDALVLNDTKVFPARLRAKKASTGANIEILLLNEMEKGVWNALLRPGKRVKVGTMLSIPDARQADTVEVIADRGAEKTLRFYVDDVRRLCWRVGEVPLPPYIKRETEPLDTRRYQTVFAKTEGAAAAPTAGLHFSPQMMKDIRGMGVSLEFVTLHTGLGTFQPLEHENVTENELYPERYRITAKTARRLSEIRRKERKIVAVGTTTLRLLETVYAGKDKYTAGEGLSDIFIHPGREVLSADALVTNFHLPRSSLLLLVSAFAEKNIIMKAYKTAVEEEFRFYSYGDAMLII